MSEFIIGEHYWIKPIGYERFIMARYAGMGDFYDSIHLRHKASNVLEAIYVERID